MSSEDIGIQISENQQRIYGYVYSLTGNRSASWDILQETNLVIWKKRAEFKKGTRFESWALTVARYQVMAYLRDRKREPLDILTPELVDAFSEDPETESELWLERIQALRVCRGQLADQSRKLLRLYYEEGLPMKEISSKLKMNINAIKQALFRARRSLQDCIEINVPVSSK